MDYQPRPYGSMYDIGAYEYFKGQGQAELPDKTLHFLKSATVTQSAAEVRLEFQYGLNDSLEIQLFDSIGKRLLTQKYIQINTTSLTIPIPTLSGGTYIVLANYKNQVDSVKLLIVKP
jgi:hypothetical protein